MHSVDGSFEIGTWKENCPMPSCEMSKCFFVLVEGKHLDKWRNINLRACEMIDGLEKHIKAAQNVFSFF